MNVLDTAFRMLEKSPLCDHCLGRQFAFLGRGMENDEKGRMIKSILVMEAQALTCVERSAGIHVLKILAKNGFSKIAEETLRGMRTRVSRNKFAKTCFLCENRFEILDELAKKAIEKLGEYDYTNFSVGIELPVEVEEREDEFKARFGVEFGENMKLEFGRLLGVKIALNSLKKLEYRKPEIVILINPMTEEIRVQVNPLYISGRYKKLARHIPQSKWFCMKCKGKGCEECNWTGKMYLESVEELICQPFLNETGGVKTSFHASGREDIDARMLGKGRPFVIEISQPKKRSIDLKKMEENINKYAKGKIEVSNLQFADKDLIRKLKKAESSVKEYRVIIEFEKDVAAEDLKLLEEKLTNTVVRQKTPSRVLHRRADLTREKYIYKVKVKRLSTKKAEMRVRCQGGLYVKELVTGDEGRTLPSVSEILGQRANPIELDVLDVIM
ncbi:MAG: tRNA pseudouridine(54/55) synthase Pus10 [Candidatus Bathyarchaeia archaeon]